MKSLAEKIESLPPAGEVKLSEASGVTVKAERSGDGKTLRFVRYTKDFWTVFKTCSFVRSI